MKTVAAIIAVAAAITGVAAPAAAQDQGKVKVSYDAKTQKYCVKQVLPSSIVPSIRCRTASEWADVGVTITHKPAVQLAQR
ncbi:hypothetical protein DM806_10810 [Sphingobium lactosutens]|uniref:hypothetical protein n=1 Tax=Sphingobium lactosutens TaxID=522773 RepID=UPI0015BCA828|nr:hypothetical protein [Sphingobium lactosutens]NWK96161.1 hypothetical protein [Sphingobium lactosutens]